MWRLLLRVRLAWRAPWLRQQRLRGWLRQVDASLQHWRLCRRMSCATEHRGRASRRGPTLKPRRFQGDGLGGCRCGLSSGCWARPARCWQIETSWRGLLSACAGLGRGLQAWLRARCSFMNPSCTTLYPSAGACSGSRGWPRRSADRRRKAACGCGGRRSDRRLPVGRLRPILLGRGAAAGIRARPLRQARVRQEVGL